MKNDYSTLTLEDLEKLRKKTRNELAAILLELKLREMQDRAQNNSDES